MTQKTKQIGSRLKEIPTQDEHDTIPAPNPKPTLPQERRTITRGLLEQWGGER